MKNILLINTSYNSEDKEFSSFGPPLGILSIASVLEELGHNVFFVDPQVDTDYKQQIDEYIKQKPLFVGMSLYLGGNVNNAVKLSARVKELSPDTPVVWGGPAASSLPEVCLNEAAVDFVVSGAGEESIVKLTKLLINNDFENASKLEHVSMRKSDGSLKIGTTSPFKGNIEHMSRIRLDKWQKGIERTGAIPLITSRGCPYQCHFCYNTFTEKGKFYVRSAESVIEEMEYWHRELGMDSFVFMDDNFLLDEQRAIDIFNYAEKQGYKISRVYGHLSNFTPRIKEILNAKKISVTMCIESGSKRIRTLLNKHINIERALMLISELTSSGVYFITAFMFGLPGETNEDIRKSIEVAVRVRDLSPTKTVSMCYIYAPQPDDKIISKTGWREKVNFSLETLGGVEVIPVADSDVIDLRLRPWLTEEDMKFYYLFVKVWQYHFNPGYRSAHSGFDISGAFKENPRIAKLFTGISYV